MAPPNRCSVVSGNFVGILFGKYFWWTDAVLSFIVALMIGWASFEILSKEITSLPGESPTKELLFSIQETAQKTSLQPLHLHHIHIYIYGQCTELSCHIKLLPNMSLNETHEICTNVELVILEKIGCISTIHPEPIDW